MDLKRNSIDNLLNDQGELKHGLCDLLSIASSYYENLYKSIPTNEAMENVFIANVESFNSVDI